MVVDERVQEQATLDQPAEPTHSPEDPYTVANIVTLLRLMLVPFFFAVLIRGRHNFGAFVLFAIAASTDWLDGQIARRTGTVTALGKAIDPLVDRLLIAAGVFGLWLIDRLPGWLVFVLFARDVYLGYGAWRLETIYHTRLPVTYTGKITTALLMFGFADLVLGWPIVPGLAVLKGKGIDALVHRLLPGFGTAPVAVGIWFIYLGALFSLATAVQYSVLYLRAVRQGEAAKAA